MLDFAVFRWVHFLLSESLLHCSWSLAFDNHAVVGYEARVRVVFVHACLRGATMATRAFEGLVHKLRLCEVAVARVGCLALLRARLLLFLLPTLGNDLACVLVQVKTEVVFLAECRVVFWKQVTFLLNLLDLV